MKSDSFSKIQERYPWPKDCPPLAAVPWSMDYGGRRLITDLLTERDVRVVLEIGSFVGGSTRQWLNASPKVVVMCIDPWADITGRRPHLDSHPVGSAFNRQLRTPEGLFHSFLSSTWDVKDRVIPVRGRAEDKLTEIAALGLEPELIYIDADKKGGEIPLCDKLFPDALISGDDWNWSDGYSFSIRAPARRSAGERQRVLKNVGNTWLIDDQPWNTRERILQLRAMPRSAAQIVHSLLRRLLGKTSTGAVRKNLSNRS